MVSPLIPMEILVYEPFMEAYAFADIKRAASDTSGAVVSRTLSYERRKNIQNDTLNFDTFLRTLEMRNVYMSLHLLRRTI